MLAERGAGDVPPGELDAMYDSLLTASLELLGRLDLRYLAADQLPAAPPTAADGGGGDDDDSVAANSGGGDPPGDGVDAAMAPTTSL